jgi:hypothetical protein
MFSHGIVAGSHFERLIPESMALGSQYSLHFTVFGKLQQRSGTEPLSDVLETLSQRCESAPCGEKLVGVMGGSGNCFMSGLSGRKGSYQSSRSGENSGK